MKKRSSKKSDINLNKNVKFPSISRSITEGVVRYLKKERVLLGALALSIFLFGGLVYASLDLYASLQSQKRVKEERVQLQKNIAFWQQVVTERPDYRDGYFMLATLVMRNGQRHEADVYLQKALQIDPNFKEGRELEKMLLK